MASHIYIRFLILIFIFISIIYFFAPISIIVNLLGSALIVLIICWKLNNAINRLSFVNRIISANGKAVLITGCDTGFGNALALKLNEFGFYVIAMCLNVNSESAKQLINKALFPNKIIVLELDVTKDFYIKQSYAEVLKFLRENSLQLWSLVNNAGIFEIGFVEWGNGIEAYRRTVDVNVFGCVRMTRLYLPLIRESRGRVINMSSVASRMSIDGYSAYCMSKHALQAFTDTLRKEMYSFGVRVISVEPSCYRTPIAAVETVSKLQDKVWNETSADVRKCYSQEFMNKFKSSYAKQAKRARDPQEVIDAMVDAVINGEPDVRYKCCGVFAGFIWSLAEVLPSKIFDDIWRLISNFEVFSK